MIHINYKAFVKIVVAIERLEKIRDNSLFPLRGKLNFVIDRYRVAASRMVNPQ